MGKRGKDNNHTNNNINKDLIYINDMDLEYVSTTKYKYDNEMSYFKIIDSAIKAKLTPIRDMEFNSFRMLMDY